MIRLSYKPGLLTQEVNLTVEDDCITFEQGSEKQQLAYQDIVKIRYWAISAQQTRFTGLDLSGSGANEIRIRMNFAEPQVEESATFNVFQSILAEVLEAILVNRPDLKVELGQKDWVNWTIFLMGVCLIFLAIGLPIIGFVDGKGDRLTNALMPLFLAGVVGAGMCWSFRPWQKRILLDIDVVLLTFGRGPLAEKMKKQRKPKVETDG